ncbi:unnamed protein product [Laminaria digitata]
MFSMPTQILTEVTVSDPVHGDTVYPVYVDVAPSGEGIVRMNLTDSAQVNADETGLCDECSLSAVAGECVSGDCEHYDMEATNANMEIESVIFGDPHMVGLLDQKIDWACEDGGWYCLVSDGEDFQLNVRVTAPMPEEFLDRQHVSGVSLLLRNGYSLVVEVKNPYTIETDGCVAGNNSRVWRMEASVFWLTTRKLLIYRSQARNSSWRRVCVCPLLISQQSAVLLEGTASGPRSSLKWRLPNSPCVRCPVLLLTSGFWSPTPLPPRRGAQSIWKVTRPTCWPRSPSTQLFALRPLRSISASTSASTIKNWL